MSSTFLKGSPSGLLNLEKIRAEKARRRLVDFTTFTYPGYRVNWHHAVVCAKLDQFIEGSIKRLMLFMPPQHGKSELVSRRLPAKLFGNNPDARIIACSYSSDLASRMNRDTQRIIDSDEYRQVFPETTLYGKNIRTVANGSYLRNSEIFEIVNHRGVYRSAGVGGGITGMGFTHGIIDDPFKDRQEADSETIRNSVWDWYTSTFYTRQAPGAGILITLTRWHEDDLAGRLLRLQETDPNADKWEIVKFPAIAEEERSPDDPREVGDIIWPGQYTREFYESVKANNMRDFTALYQQRPSPAEGGMLKRGWWQFYRELPASFDTIIQSWDMTFKDTKSANFVVGQVWGRKGANTFLLDQVRDKLDFPATIRAVQSLSSKWPQAGAKLVEDRANGPAVIQVLKGQVPGLIAIEPDGSKEARVAAVSSMVEAGNVYLPDPSRAPWIHDYIEECAAFPNGSNDDQVDATSQALKRLYDGQGQKIEAEIL